MRLAIVMLSGVLFTQVTLATQVDYKLGPEVSDYQRFVLYPHLQKGFTAMQRGHRDRAIAEFEQARTLQPENPVIALYLARCYEHFGQDKEAIIIARQQLAVTPQNADLLALLVGLQRKEPLDHSCALLECKVAQAERKLLDSNLQGLAIALDDPELSAAPQGLTLRHNLLQRSLGEHNWGLAARQFARLDETGDLTKGELKQWLNMLLIQGDIAQAALLRRRFPNLDGELDLAIALALDKDHDETSLKRYLQTHYPQFPRAAQEREWLQLAAKSGLLNGTETLQFAENRRFYARLMLPVLRQEGRWVELDRLLVDGPAHDTAELAFESALHQHQWDKLGKAGRDLIRGSKLPMVALERVSYRLQQVGLLVPSRDLLIDYWPYEGANLAGRETLIKRLIWLQSQGRTTLLPIRFYQPLQDPGLRSLQISLLAQSGQCDGVVSVVGNLQAQHDTNSWRALGSCYRQDKPGLAEYAFMRAASTGEPRDVRQLAYQAYENRHYDAALKAWQQVTLAPVPEEQLAAIRTALEAGDISQAKRWLTEYDKASLPKDAEYWRVRARTQEDALAIASLKMAIGLSPRAEDYAQLARHYQQLGQTSKASAALHTANQLAPNNRDYKLAYSYALQRDGKLQAASDNMESIYREGDALLAEQLVYLNQSLANSQKALYYARRAIDEDPSAQKSYGLRRLHEDLGRRWTYSFDAWAGTGQGTVSGIGGNSVAQSYAQTEVEYRLGHESIRGGKTLSVFGRLFGSSQSQRIDNIAEGSSYDGTYIQGDGSNPLNFRDPTLGIGVRWKPFRNQTLFFSAEEQLPLNTSQGGEHDTLIRVSTSFLNDGRYSDEWHMLEGGWLAQNVYMDATRYLRSQQTNLVADYRLSYHHKIGWGNTLEPYGHIQWRQYWNDKSSDTGYYNDGGKVIAYSSGEEDYSLLMGGIGIRWNHWFGETQYDAWPHKLSLGVEYQLRLRSNPVIRKFESGKEYDKGALMMTMGVRW